jgi:glucan endo-1,3-alpha-glucosidase
MFENHPVLDCAFSWAAWASDNQYKTLDEDNIYTQGAQRNGKQYMAPISPWFFTHFSYKNWIYKSEALFTQRWEQLIALQPEFIEIITWNDYGESHYVGPIDGAFPAGSDVWTVGYDHTAWLDLASYYIKAYKAGSYPAVTQDQVFYWYRTHSKYANMNDGIPRPNNADWAEDNVVIHALLTSSAEIQVQIGGASTTLYPNAGRNTFQVPFGEGNVVITLRRNGQTLAS